jgi:hypothetical protein
VSHLSPSRFKGHGGWVIVSGGKQRGVGPDDTQSNSHEETLEKQEVFNEQIFENYSEQSELNSNVEEQKESDDSNYED